jgi:hypothetical protein
MSRRVEDAKFNTPVGRTSGTNINTDETEFRIQDPNLIYNSRSYPTPPTPLWAAEATGLTWPPSLSAGLLRRDDVTKAKVGKRVCNPSYRTQHVNSLGAMPRAFHPTTQPIGGNNLGKGKEG